MSVALRAALFGLARAGIFLSISLSAAVLLLGWGLRSTAILHPWTGSAAMIPHTALCLILIGCAMLWTTAPTQPVPMAVRALCYAVPVTVALVMSLQYAVDLGAVAESWLGIIDERHRMSVGTAIGLVLLAYCTLRLFGETSGRSDLTFALVAFGNTAMASILTVHSFDVHSAFALPGVTSMSAVTAAAMMMLFGALMLALVARQESPVPEDWDLSRG